MSGENSNQHKTYENRQLELPNQLCPRPSYRGRQCCSTRYPTTLVTGLRGDKDCRIWLAQASSTSPSALGENLLSAIPKTVKGQIAEDGLLNDIAPPTGIGL
jgi:hypothetical protein